jgi:hypothetical protein
MAAYSEITIMPSYIPPRLKWAEGVLKGIQIWWTGQQIEPLYWQARILKTDEGYLLFVNGNKKRKFDRLHQAKQSAAGQAMTWLRRPSTPSDPPHRTPTTTMPERYWDYHAQQCGTVYRGCDPVHCPKDVWETTGVWLGPEKDIQ